MRLPSAFLAVLGVLSSWAALAQDLNTIPFDIFTPSTYLNSTGLTDAVQWDGYSLFVMGQRVYLWSGEIHSESALIPLLQLGR